MMTTPLSALSLQAQTAFWRTEYERLLERRLEASIRYMRLNPQDNVKLHLRSLLALIDEAQRYRSLNSLTLDLIHLLNPLPIQWGMGSLWLHNLQFAAPKTTRISERYSYLADIADIEIANGSFDTCLDAAGQVLAGQRSDPILAARACRTKFIALRSLGRADDADQLLQSQQSRFNRPHGKRADPRHARAWIIYSQSKLELLREQGKIDEAFYLVQQMLELDAQSGSHDPGFTGELLTLRSTLLWGKGDFRASIEDLKLAIDKYTRLNDTFHAVSLHSNLGLVYWSMGELDRAEESLNTAINYYRKTGAAQLVTSDLGNLGLVYFARGNLSRAQELFNEQIDLARRISYLTEYYRGIDNFADVNYYLGHYQKLIDMHEQNSTYIRSRGRREGYGVGILWIACAEYRQGYTAGALDKIHEVLEYAKTNRHPSLEGLACRCLAQFLPLEQREPLLLKALDISRSQGKLLDEAASYLALAQVQASVEPGESTWQKGAELLERIGAAAWVEGHSAADPPFIPMFI